MGEQAPEAGVQMSLASLARQDRVRVLTAGGQWIEGDVEIRGGMLFLIERRRAAGRPIPETHGPLTGSDVQAIELVQAAGDVRAAREARRLGELIDVGRPASAAAYRAALYALADARRAAAQRAGGFRRQLEISAQFDRLADEIALARTKRRYLLCNTEPGVELSPANWVSSPVDAMAFRRPRPQDFDPDPRVRRRRVGDAARLQAEADVLARRQACDGRAWEYLLEAVDGALGRAAERWIAVGCGWESRQGSLRVINCRLDEGQVLRLALAADPCGRWLLAWACLAPGQLP